MTGNMYIKRELARMALSGVTTSFQKVFPDATLIECDLVDNTAKIRIIAVIDGKTRRFESTITEYLHYENVP